MPLYTERITADVIDGFNGFLYNLRRKFKELVEKESEDIEIAVKADLAVIDPFLCSVDSKLSSPCYSS